MHEHSLLNNLMHKIEQVVHEQHAERATKVTIRLGAFSHISPGHFREHFDQAKPGTVADGAELEVYASDDESDPFAQEMILESLEVEQV
ncbi:MAG: hydrogenase maturation nickel metallochaperone HypA [Verrucomicrobiae bacterium]|nr:hydrogenase maturation nickel metallochaperone HypA [Verrucomicrobiae bacterium]